MHEALILYNFIELRAGVCNDARVRSCYSGGNDYHTELIIVQLFGSFVQTIVHSCFVHSYVQSIYNKCIIV